MHDPSGSIPDSYVLRTGLRGAARLQVLAQAASPATRALLDRVGPGPGWRCLDMGCGIGSVSRELRQRGAWCLGVDRDPHFVAFAQEQGGHYRLGSLEAFEVEGDFDLVYARYLLSHLNEPAQALSRLASLLRPGGTLALEDVDFPGHHCEPPSPAFVRYLELYQAVAAQPRLGRQLWTLARQAALEVTYAGLAVPLFANGPQQRVTELTLAQIAPAVLRQGLETRASLARLIRELRAHRRAGALVSLAPTFQVLALRV